MRHGTFREVILTSWNKTPEKGIYLLLFFSILFFYKTYHVSSPTDISSCTNTKRHKRTWFYKKSWYVNSVLNYVKLNEWNCKTWDDDEWQIFTKLTNWSVKSWIRMKWTNAKRQCSESTLFIYWVYLVLLWATYEIKQLTGLSI